MPCYQVSQGNAAPSGATIYSTQADCLNACKEGACCEGTTCTVKPQCQCQGTGKTFKGIGTTCEQGTSQCCSVCLSPLPNSGCPWCSCFCGDGLAAYPRFINITLSGTYDMWGPTVTYGFAEVWNMYGRYKQKSYQATVTLAAVSGITNSTHNSSTDARCQQWQYGDISTGGAPIGSGGMMGQISAQVNLSSTSSQAFFEVALDWYRDTSEVVANLQDSWATNWQGNSPANANPNEWRTPAVNPIGMVADSGPYTSGTCLSRMVGAAFAAYLPLKSINGVQA